MFGLLFAAEGVTEGLTKTAHEIGEKFGFNLQLFVSQIIGFAILAWALNKWAIKPISKMLDERRDTISESLANAERIKSELANAEVKSREIVSQASLQANKIIEEARAAAAKISEQEGQRAVAAAADIIAKAKQANDAELVRMKTELRKEVTRLVVDVSASVTGGILSVEQKQRLAEDANKQLANN
jgi:F-type H+-transporting ATPase subunit b